MIPLKTTPEERAALRAEEERRRSDAARCPSVRFSQLYDRGGRLLCALDDLDTLAAALDEREAAMHMRVRGEYDRTIADAWRAKLAEAEAERDAIGEASNRLKLERDTLAAEVGRYRNALRDLLRHADATYPIRKRVDIGHQAPPAYHLSAAAYAHITELCRAANISSDQDDE